MKLYDSSHAPNPRRVRIFLREKGLTVPIEVVDISKRAHKSAAFAALNPLQRTPVLVLDDGTVIAESIAICRYFEELHPLPAVFGVSPKQRALIEMWQRRMELSFFVHVSNAFRHAHPVMADLEVPQIPEFAQCCKPKALEFLAILDRELAGRPFIAGQDFSVADITGLVAIDFMRPARIPLPSDLANVERWHASVSARPSATA